MSSITSLPVIEAPPVLSTPDTRIFEESVPVAQGNVPTKSDEDIAAIYETDRVAREILQGQWTRIALQFPDHLLVDAPRVSKALLHRLQPQHDSMYPGPASDGDTERTQAVPQTRGAPEPRQIVSVPAAAPTRGAKIFILADTSYGACCVDEVAAEHSDADVVVHYGRACLSPTARLPVIYCYTQQPISQGAVVEAFSQKYRDHEEQVILMADLPYHFCLEEIFQNLQGLGYHKLFVAKVMQDAGSPLSNRTIPPNTSLQEWSLFHISEPTPSLLLTLTSRVRAISFFPTDSTASTPPQALDATTTSALKRRYALLTSLSTVSIFGILINTLSVRNYMQILKHVKSAIAAAGKKSYTFVVGKVNAAKIANFSEVGGWVVIGCWESSLFEAKDFWKPIITPFELDLALQRDSDRLWTGKWSSNFQEILDPGDAHSTTDRAASSLSQRKDDFQEPRESDDSSTEEESAPPEFDLRTGQYVSHTRPTGRPAFGNNNALPARESGSQALTRRARGELTNSEHISPAAEYLAHHRTWQGLGSDFGPPDVNAQAVEGASMERGRHGIAKGYRVEEEGTTD